MWFMAKNLTTYPGLVRQKMTFFRARCRDTIWSIDTSQTGRIDEETFFFYFAWRLQIGDEAATRYGIRSEGRLC